MQSSLGIFAKHPDFGPVKTRLAATIGNLAASQIARLMLVFLLARLKNSLDHREIICWPPDSCETFRTLAGIQWNQVPQIDGDLGTKMNHWFDHATSVQQGAAIAIGSDCPTIRPDHVDLAAKHLADGSDLVLGPARDGGYWLIGLRQPAMALFTGVQWSSSQVLEKTLANANSLGWKTELLDEMEDVDELSSLKSALIQLRKQPDAESLDLADNINAILAST